MWGRTTGGEIATGSGGYGDVAGEEEEAVLLCSPVTIGIERSPQGGHPVPKPPNREGGCGPIRTAQRPPSHMPSTGSREREVRWLRVKPKPCPRNQTGAFLSSQLILLGRARGMPFSPSSPVGHGAMRRELQGERGPLAESRPKPNPRNHTDAFPPSQVILPGRALSGCPSPLPHSLRWPRPLAIAKPAKSPGENNRGGRPEARNTKPRMHGAAPLGCNRTHGAEARGFLLWFRPGSWKVGLLSGVLPCPFPQTFRHTRTHTHTPF